MEHTKFKVGDRVVIARRNPGNTTGVQKGWNRPNGNAGGLGYVTSVDHKDTEMRYELHIKEDGTDYLGWFSDGELRAASGKVAKSAVPKFILQYETDTDPFEFFATEKELRKRIAELAERSDLKRDSLVVYVIRRTRTVKLGVKITISK